ncbi:MAG: hypothetical protein NW224_01115 [Leptolyngbyaceae cyanobacterium bins.302]|nr:hypothetical protein [Leptolyngbyaceae cyanobacterium bins.302]
MGKKLTLHLQQNTTLERVVSIVEFCSQGGTDLDELGGTCGLGASVLQKVVFPFLRSVSILSKKNPPTLTDLGWVAAKIHQENPAILSEFFHSLIYNLHYQEPDKRFSWVYSTVVQQLWQRKEVVLSVMEKNSLVSQVIEAATEKFDLPSDEIAFSSNSITGVLNWLRALEPSVVDGGSKAEHFNLRYFCAAPAIVKAVDNIYQQGDRTYGVKIFLRENVQDALCQMLLLDPSGLPGVLDNAKATYDYDEGSFFDWGYEGGYGQWVMLNKPVDWLELIT